MSSGKAWTSDYGDPHDAHDFDFIYPISPLHNVPTDRKLPPTILLTADREYDLHKKLLHRIEAGLQMMTEWYHCTLSNMLQLSNTRFHTILIRS